MGVDGVKFLVQLRKLVIRTVRTSTRSVRNHPFLVGAFLFVIFLYRSSPFLFSLLVSASPVLVCTAVLLGTLLSFGNPQIPEIERDEKISCEVSSLRAGSAPNSATVFQKEAEVFDRDDPYTEAGREILGDKDVEDSASMGDVCSDSKFGEHSREIVFEQQSVVEVNAEYTSQEVEYKKESDEETLAFEDAFSAHEVQGNGMENEGSAEGSVDGHMDDHFESEDGEVTLTFGGARSAYEVLERGLENEGSLEGSDDGHVDDHVESSSVPWTRVNGDDHGDDDDDDDDADYEPSDSGSDGAESSSPDPSMADIIPLLDELHPLIECENLIPANLSRESSGLLNNRSHSSHVSSINSDEETDHKEEDEEEEEEEEEAGGDDDDEENQADKEDVETPAAITWTADDQKNLMDLGSSELERNLRLESLIARRRSRRSMKMTTERNLIDLEDFDFHFQVAPISTRRQNPFDFPNDTFDDMGLPPIPGSAPSRLMPRRNPFDIPYDSGEEKPDLMGDSFQQEFMHLNQKEHVFRRHESFHIGSSSFEFPRQDIRDYNRASRFKPYFIPERLPSEGSSYTSFMRQSSGISELSGSSSFHRQTSGISEASSFQRQSSDVSESKASSASETEPVSAEVDQAEMKLGGDHDSTEERVLDPEIDRASEHVEHGSQSSDNLDEQLEKRDFDFNMPEIVLGESETYTGTEFHQPDQGHNVEINLGSSGNDRDLDSWVSEARDLAASTGNIEGEMHLTASPVEDKHYSSSPSSFSSEEHNDVKGSEEGLVKEEEIGFHLIEKPGVQADNLFEAPDFHPHHSAYTHSAERSPFETNLTLETIDEEHNITSCSSLSSEEHNTAEGLKSDETSMNMQQIRPDADNNSDFPTEQAPDASNVCFNMGVEESHPKDPVYDLSPQASNISLSISCEELVDLGSKDLKQEMDGLLLKNDGEADARVHQEDPILSVKEERHADTEAELSSSAQADLFNTVNELIEEPILGHEDALLSGETSFYSANLVDVPGNYEEKLISVKEEPVEIPEKLEEVSTANRLHSEVYSEMNDLLNLPLQGVSASSGVQELRQETIADFFDFGEPVEARTGFDFESTILGDLDGKSQLSGSSVPENIDHIKELEEALLSELDVVGDFRVTELGMDLTQDALEVEEASGVPVPEAILINKTELEAEKVEAVTDELPDYRMLESMTWSQALEPESVENTEQPIDENDKKPAPELLFFNTYESKVEDAETCIAEFPESHVLESKTAFHVLEPESSQNIKNSSDENVEISGTIKSIHIRDELQVGGTEVGPVEGFESAIRTDEPVAFDGRLEKEPVEVVNRPAPTTEEEIERSAFAAIDVSSDSHVIERETVIEKEEPDVEINDFAPAVEEEIARSAAGAIDVFSDSHVSESRTVIEEDEPAAEMEVSTPTEEEEIRMSAVEAIDVLSESHVSEIKTVIEKDEQTAEMNVSSLPVEGEIEKSPVESIDVISASHVSESNTGFTVTEEDDQAAELSKFSPSAEEEIERSGIEVIHVPSDSHASERSTVIEEDEAAAELNEPACSVEEDIVRSAIDSDVPSDSHASERNTAIEEDESDAELNESAPSVEEDIESSAMEAIGVPSDSHASERNTMTEEDEPAAELNERAPSVEEEIVMSAIEAIDAPSELLASERNTVIEEDEPAAEMNESAPAVEEEIERSAIEAIDALSDPHVLERNTVIEEDEPAAEMNESAPVMEEEVERSSVEAIDALSVPHVSERNTVIEEDEPAAEINESASVMEEEVERSAAEAIGVFSESNTVIEGDEPAAEMKESAPVMEEEVERSPVEAIGVFSESNTVIEGDEPAVEMNESAPAVDEDIGRSDVEAIDVLLDSHVSESDTVIENDEPAAEMNETAPAVEEEIKSSALEAIDVLSDSHFSKSNTVIEEYEPPAVALSESAPALEEEIERSAIAAIHSPPLDSHVLESAEMNESAPVMKEEIEGSGVDVSSDFHVSNSYTVIEKDEPAIEGESGDGLVEMENRQAESSVDFTVTQCEPEQPTPPLSVGHPDPSTESISATEESDTQESSKADPEMPKKEEK